MEVYLVGGAVRDLLLGLPVTERDWLVTGTTPEALRRLGYRQVGKDFPVFLHPQTHEQYALPRFARYDPASGPVSIEEDLRRRDLTINAMAQAADGRIIDPCGGQADLKQRLLRHTPAFTEDPLRVLRLARLAARLHPLGFHLAPETRQLVADLAVAGCLDDLVAERVWAELARALEEDAAQVFFEALHATRALLPILPELDRLFGVPQPARYHPEIDTGVHSLMVLEQACCLSPDPKVRFAALVHDLGKGTTPPELWPRHRGHERRSAELIEGLCRRLHAPNSWRDLAIQVALYHSRCHRALELRPATLLETLEALDAIRRPQRLEPFLLACEADIRGRAGLERQPYPQADYLRAAHKTVAKLDIKAIVQSGADGQTIGTRVTAERVRALAALREDWR